MKRIILCIITLLIATSGSMAQNWNEMIKAVASDRAASDLFGFTISIDGDRAAISAPLEGEDGAGGNAVDSAGAVYIFELDAGIWMETAKIVASDRALNDRFGARICLEGDRIVIGSYIKDDVGAITIEKAGAVYVFDLIGSVWTETAKLVASDIGIDNRFGYDVSLSGDRIAVGSFYNDTDAAGANPIINAGAAYIFELAGGTWTETTKLVASDREAANFFGLSLSMVGETVIIGAYRNRYDELGANPLTNAGSAYVFNLVGGVWTETAKLVASDRDAGDYFGHNIKMDGNKAIIGAYNRDEPGIGSMTGTAYIFELNGGLWTETAKLLPSDIGAIDHFGYSVDISGNRAIVGARHEDHDENGGNILNNSGSAYIFELSGGVWSETNKLVASDREENDLFSISVGISGDMVMVGSYREDEDASGGNTLDDAGSVYIFNTCSGIPSVSVSGVTLTASVTGAAYQWLDCDNGNSIIVSATNQSFTPTNNGNYAVAVTIGDCIDTSLCTSITSLGMNTSGDEAKLSIYPNPVNSLLTVETSGNIRAIEIVNILGKVIAVHMNNNIIDVSELPKGIYLLKIQTTEYESIVKMIKD
ncbi:MAG: T9SS type A sorting domain-containing protein [Crocinitomicaceae bacterium]